MNKLVSILLGSLLLATTGCDQILSDKSTKSQDSTSTPKQTTTDPGSDPSNQNVDSLAANSDWVIDACRITYKGNPVPLNADHPAFVRLFGPPSDSVIGDSSAFGGRKRIYFWDNLGLTTLAFVKELPAKYTVTINFMNASESQTNKSNSSRSAKGHSSVGIRPFGRLDSLSQQRILGQAFYESAGSLIRQIDLSGGSYIEIHPTYRDYHDSPAIGLDLYLSTPSTAAYQTYPEIYAALGTNCKLPGAR